MNGLAGCSVSTIGKPHEYFDLTGSPSVRSTSVAWKQLQEHVSIFALD